MRLFVVSTMMLLATAMAQDIPATGEERPNLAAFDDAVRSFMSRHSVEGAALAVYRDGKLVLARGYGWADREADRLMQPDTLIRIASVSKTLTAIALEDLVNNSKIALDDRAFADHLKGFLPADADARYAEIRVGNLAAHTAGLTGDPRCSVADPVRLVDAPEPPTSDDLARFFPRFIRLTGAAPAPYSYSNPSYQLLGRTLEKASGESLESLIRRTAFLPFGLLRPRFGKTRVEDFATGETLYPDVPRRRMVSSVFPGVSAPQLLTQGGCVMESQEALGGVAASVIDLATLYASRPIPSIPVNAAGEHRLLSNNAYGFYGLHVEGNGTVVRRFGPGNSIAVSFNSSDNETTRPQTPNADIDAALLNVWRATTEWPEDDLFPVFKEKWETAFPATVPAEAVVFEPGEKGIAPAPVTVRVDGPEGTPFRVNSHALWLEALPKTGTLPADITLRANLNGVVPGYYPDQVFVEHATEPANPVTFPVRLTVPEGERPRTLRVRPAGLAPLAVGQTVTLALAAEGGTPPYKWSVSNGTLPEGLALAEETGRLTGTPAAPGLADFTVRVTDARGWTADRGLSAAVGVPGHLSARSREVIFTPDAVTACNATPAPATSFRRSDTRMTALFRFNGSLRVGDQVLVDWLDSAGTSRSRTVFNSATTWGNAFGTGCYWATVNPSTLAGAPAGEWTLRVTWNRHVLAESKFRME